MALDADTRRAMLERVERFIREDVAPEAAAIDRADAFPRALFAKAADLGLFALGVPEDYGGLGRDIETPILLSERIARASAAFSLSFNNTTDAAVPILDAAQEKIKRRYLPAIAKGAAIPCIAISEPQGGSDVASIRTVAVRKGDRYVIDGRKMWCTNAPVGDVFTVFAKTDQAGGHKGLSAFVVPAGTPGLVVGPAEPLMGLRGSPVAEIAFDGVEVPADHILGVEGDGFRLAMLTLDESRLHCAATALGVATAALDLALGYARERVQFGQKIIRHQAIQALLARRASELAAARALWREALARLLADHDRPASAYAGMAKLVCSELCMAITVDAVQVFGASGLSRNGTVERLMRDAKAFEIYDGTSQIQAAMIGKHLERHGLPFV
ncbi:MAG: acyl-CoA dehydrogenase family protein [Alphaproteobacteria bacterium]